ncbi:gluconate 2-dehydrogenase subunit 3 family protein [Acidipila sp. EB88]|uniref:gluconate 2-dehydrogenase subunit 3 family protein n=1 Tax=Acidipila sp. EB88 TaxID=2305226 RepID=UPI0013158A03|nr:gluconate 2-dehydrogenase subunit 3 family protein [Acidipila sp. EB88]
MPQTPTQARGISAPLLEILKSPRVSTPTRTVLRRRLEGPPADYKPTCITPEAFQILERVLARLLPEDEDGAPGANELSLAARLEQQRAAGHGNGWRYASLPPDAQALSTGLARLDESAQHRHRRHFVDLTEDRADALLHRVQNGEEKWEGLDSSRWFEEILADATELYVAHPATMDAMGFDGFADEPAGWPAHAGGGIGINNTEAWELKGKHRSR